MAGSGEEYVGMSTPGNVGGFAGAPAGAGGTMEFPAALAAVKGFPNAPVGAGAGDGSEAGAGNTGGVPPGTATPPPPTYATPEIQKSYEGFQNAGMPADQLAAWLASANTRSASGMGAGLGVPQTDVMKETAPVAPPTAPTKADIDAGKDSGSGNKIVTVTSVNPALGKGQYVVYDASKGRNVMVSEDNLGQYGLKPQADVSQAWAVQIAGIREGGNAAEAIRQQNQITNEANALIKNTGGTMEFPAALATVKAWHANPADPQFLQMSRDQLALLMNVAPLTQPQYESLQSGYNQYQRQNTVALGVSTANNDPVSAVVQQMVKQLGLSTQQAIDYYDTYTSGGKLPANVKTFLDNNPAYISQADFDRLTGGNEELANRLQVGGMQAYAAYRDQFLKQYDIGGGNFNVLQAVLDAKNEPSMNFLRTVFGEKAVNDTAGAIKQAAQKLGVADPTRMTQAEVQEKISGSSDPKIAQTMVTAGVPYSTVQAAYQAMQDNWEATVLPRLSSKLQGEYGEAKTSNDFTKFNADFNDVLAAQSTVAYIMKQHEIDPNDPQAITKALAAGLGLSTAIRAGYDETEIRNIDAQLKAQQAMKEYGFLPPEMAGPPEKGKTYSIPDLAAYARANPTGLQTVRDFYGNNGDVVAKQVQEYNDALSASIDKLQSNYLGNPKFNNFSPQGIALDDAIRNAGLQGIVFPDATPKSVNDTIVWFDKSGKALDGKDVQQSQWNNMTQEQKLTVASLWDTDYNKNSYFAETVKGLGEASQEGGILGQIMFSPILPVVNPIAKQITLPEAKAQLTKDYTPVTQALQGIRAGYFNADGTYNTEQITNDMNANSGFRDRVLTATGYSTTDDLKNSLNYYNQAQKVSAKEWAMAGLVGVADLLGLAELGGVNVAGLLAKGIQNVSTGVIDAFGMPLGTGARAIGNLANGARLATNAVTIGVGPAIGTLQFPDVVSTVTSPTPDLGQKLLAGVGEACSVRSTCCRTSDTWQSIRPYCLPR